LEINPHNLKEYSKIKGVVPSQPDTLFACPDHSSVDETAQRNDTPFCLEVMSSCTLAPYLPTETVGRPPQICSIKDKPQTPICDALEDERPDPQERTDTSYCLSINDGTTSPLSHDIAGEMPNTCQHIATPHLSSVSNALPLVVTTAPSKATPPSDPSTDT
jgi:hypothetical protein